MSTEANILEQLSRLRRSRKEAVQQTQLAIQQNNQQYQQKMSSLE